jgi:hypothetical protein
LSFSAVLGREAKPEYGQEAPVLDARLGLASGDTPSYRLSRLADATAVLGSGGSYVLKVSDQPWYLKLADWAVEPLLKATRAGLLAKPTPEPGPKPAPQGRADPVTEQAAPLGPE